MASAKEAKCLKCGLKGHLARDCTAPASCTKCGQLGHISDLCEILGMMQQEAPLVDDDRGRRGPPKPICRSCGRKGHVARKCTFTNAKCAVCGESGHFAKDCKGRGGSFFLKASKVMEGKDFAKQQAAMRTTESGKKTEELLSRVGRRQDSSQTGPKPTDILLEGPTAASVGKQSGQKGLKMSVRVVSTAGKRARDPTQEADKPSVWLTESERQQRQKLPDPEAAGPAPAEAHLGGLLAGYGSGTESDSGSEQEKEEDKAEGSDLEPATLSVGKQGKRSMMVGTAPVVVPLLPDASHLLGDGSSEGKTLSGSNRDHFLTRPTDGEDAWMSHVGRKQSEVVSKRRSELREKHRVLEMKTLGRSMLGEEIELKVTSEAGAFLSRAAGSIQHQTRTTINISDSSSKTITFRISRRPGSDDEAVRLAASTLQEGLEAFIDMLSQVPQPPGSSRAPGASRVIRGVTFTLFSG